MFSPNIVIADDDPSIRNILNIVINMLDGSIVAEVENGRQAIQAYIQHRPHIVLMDINMPLLDGIEALKTIKQINNRACVIMLTSENASGTVKDSIKAGANAYVLKGSPPEIIADEIRASWKKYIDQLSGAN